MVVAPLSDNRLSLADLEAIASAAAPTLAHGPGTSLALSKKKASAEHGHEPSASTRHSRRTAAHKAAERAPVVSRRLRRFVNDRALHLAAADIGALPTSRGELRALFERRSSTIFSVLHEDGGARAAFAPYIDLNLDDEDDKAAGKIDTREREDNRGGCGSRKQGVNNRIRQLSKQCPDVVKSLVQEIEEIVLQLDYGESIALQLHHPLARMVAHSIAQFHSLAHRSCSRGQERVLIIGRKHHRDEEEENHLDEDDDDYEHGHLTSHSPLQTHHGPRMIDILA